jgi:hypothetical protein
MTIVPAPFSTILAQVSVPFSQTFTISGGTILPYHITAAIGVLPPGLAVTVPIPSILASNIVTISGTPTLLGTYTNRGFVITDSGSDIESFPYIWVVSAAPPPTPIPGIGGGSSHGGLLPPNINFPAPLTGSCPRQIECYGILWDFIGVVDGKCKYRRHKKW